MAALSSQRSCLLQYRSQNSQVLLRHFKKPHTSSSSFLLLINRAVSCNKMPPDTDTSFLTCQNKTLRWLRLHWKHLSSLCPLGKHTRWSWWRTGVLSLRSLCCEHHPPCLLLLRRVMLLSQAVPHAPSQNSDRSGFSSSFTEISVTIKNWMSSV